MALPDLAANIYPQITLETQTELNSTIVQAYLIQLCTQLEEAKTHPNPSAQIISLSEDTSPYYFVLQTSLWTTDLAAQATTPITSLLTVGTQPFDSEGTVLRISQDATEISHAQPLLLARIVYNPKTQTYHGYGIYARTPFEQAAKIVAKATQTTTG